MKLGKSTRGSLEFSIQPGSPFREGNLDIAINKAQKERNLIKISIIIYDLSLLSFSSSFTSTPFRLLDRTGNVCLKSSGNLRFSFHCCWNCSAFMLRSPNSAPRASIVEKEIYEMKSNNQIFLSMLLASSSPRLMIRIQFCQPFFHRSEILQLSMQGVFKGLGDGWSEPNSRRFFTSRYRWHQSSSKNAFLMSADGNIFTRTSHEGDPGIHVYWSLTNHKLSIWGILPKRLDF